MSIRLRKATKMSKKKVKQKWRKLPSRVSQKWKKERNKKTKK